MQETNCKSLKNVGLLLDKDGHIKEAYEAAVTWPKILDHTDLAADPNCFPPEDYDSDESSRRMRRDLPV